MWFLLTKAFVFVVLTVVWYYCIVFLLLLESAFQWMSRRFSFPCNFVNTISAAPTEAHPDENSEQAAASSKSSTAGSKQSKKREARQRPQKRNEAPKFSTSLSGPIEAIIEETLNEELSDNPPTLPTQAPRQTTKKKTSKKGKPQKTSDKASVEKFVFVKQKSSKNQNTQKAEPEDHISQSAVTAKETSKKDNKFLQGSKTSEETLSAVIAHGTKKRKYAIKPSIIDHYKQTEGTSVSAQDSNKHPDLKISKTEYKESKKVCSDISYASIVINTTPISSEATSGTSSQISTADENCGPLEVSCEADSERSSETRNEANNVLKKESFDDFVHIDKENSNQKSSEQIKEILSSSSEASESPIRARLPKGLANFIQCTEEELRDFQNHRTEELPESNFVKLENFRSELTQTTPHLNYQTYQKEAESEQKNNLISLFELEKLNNPAPEKYIPSFFEDDLLLTQETVAVSCQKWNLEDSINIDDQIQSLEDRIIDEPYVVEETEVVLSSTINSNPEKVSEQANIVALEEQIGKDSVVGDIVLFNEPSETQWSKTSEYYIEEQIQSLEDQIIPEPYTIEESETVVTLSSANHRAETLLDVNDQPSAVENLSEIANTEKTDLINTPIHNPQPIILQKQSKALDMAPVNILVLNEKANWESRVHRIQKNVKLEFRLGPSLLGRNIKLYCNYPKATNGIVEEFNRDTYTLIKWSQDERYKNADGSSTLAQITPTIAGSFHYYFIEEHASIEDRQGSGYFIVDPVLKYGANEILPLDCIQCQTVLAKHLGPFSTWENKLRVAKESGYNMVHFTPIQELGASNSSYSVREHLKLNGTFNAEDGREPSFEDIEALAAKMREEWKMLSVCDIVLNHTANESDWIKEHPEATYNCVNCPYMRPAYLLDAAFHQFSMDVKKGLYEDRGIPAEVSTEDHLNAIHHHFKLNVLEPLKIPELFTIDENKYLEEFLALARKTEPLKVCEKETLCELEIVQDPQFRRLQSSIDLNLALKKYNSYRLDCFDEESRVRKCAEDLKVKLDALNEAMAKEVTADLSTAVENVIAGIRYFRVQPDGPQHRDITIDHPLVYRYFTDYGAPKSLAECEETMYSANGRFLMAHNGWVMNSDPLKNFADSGTKVYIRRELIAWGDSVKLRFGDKPADSPFLWNYMRQYVEQTVKIFDGIRLDNCHSTPLPVAEYLLDCARKIRPDLYVVAELFTNSDLTDNIFVNRLGITSLIREAMSAWDSHEEGRLVYRYGGVPVGAFYKPEEVPLAPMVAHALFLDLTHDNPSPVEKRSVFDLLPSTALVNMACCATGSNRGYDELVPHHIHVVDETRQYAEWTDDEVLPSETSRYVNKQSGIIAAKRALNALHFKLGVEGFDQVFVNQVDGDIVEVTRHQLGTHTSYVLVAFTSFSHPDRHAGDYQRPIKPLAVEGVLDEIVLEASLSHADSTSKFAKFGTFSKDPNWINGLTEYRLSIKEHIQLAQSDFFEPTDGDGSNFVKLNYKSFKPGSVAVLKFSLSQEMQDAVAQLKVAKTPQLSAIISNLTLADLNRALFRCGEEERDEGNGFDAYNIPNFGPTVYCGLAGITWLIRQIAIDNDLGHPLCTNLRNGNWLIEYVWKRLKVDEGTRALGQWIEEYTKPIYSIPRYLVPCYFDVVIGQIHRQLLTHSYQLMSDFINEGSPFVQSLALGSLQFGAYIRSANLPDLSPNLAPPKPPMRTNKNGETVQACITLSAGLPHFSVGYMRNWGRDTFIALRGLLILTGRFEEARQHILGYGACLRHGLIPNLLDGGKNPRFNCRDAIWWWIYSIKSYCEEAPNGTAILSDVVSRIFPSDDASPQPAGALDQPLHEVIQESLNVHFQGLKFRERNAGRQIDEHMTDAGFNNQIGIHPETGFVFGGNQWNCGTWMDKMGSSDKAGNRGKPATPRDGSAVELVGLSKASITWLWRLNDAGQYPYDGVQRTHKNGTVTKWTFREWAERIQRNFEKKFWVPVKPSPDECRPDLVNKKNMYKDSFGASQPWTDYQLRCNFPIAMVAAPELFNPQHAWAALEQAEKYLLGPLGMKTLDPEDWNYRGDYDNSNDSDDFLTSHGFNYHQGPEWVWPVGFFLRAKLMFAAQNGLLRETVANTKVILSKHFNEVDTPPWRGLPELTNRNGSYCKDSSRTQAWSMSCILEVLYDLEQIESKKGLSN